MVSSELPEESLLGPGLFHLFLNNVERGEIDKSVDDVKLFRMI